jgi:Spy/CpxP family protein refolding chaperone
VTDRPRALVILVAVFLLGAVIGASGSYFWLKNSENRREPSFGRIPLPSRGQGRQRLPDFLQLTPEQETQFKEIMAESRRRLGELQKEQRPKVDAIRDETNRRFLEILNNEQRKKFELFLKQVQGFRQRPPRGREGELPPPPPPPPTK